MSSRVILPDIKEFKIIGFDYEGYLKKFNIIPGTILYLSMFDIFPTYIVLKYATLSGEQIRIRANMTWFLSQMWDGKIVQVNEVIELNDFDEMKT
jgi:hypothetical protein